MTRLPVAWLAVAAALVLLLALSGSIAGLRWDPFGLTARRLPSAEALADRASADASARAAEVEGERDQRIRLDIHHQTLRAADIATVAAATAARTADDASLLLDPDRVDRLHAHDGQLCDLAPELDGCSASAGTAGGGEPPVRSGSVGPGPDAR